MAEQLLAHGMPVGPDNYAALYVCINNGMPGVAKLVLDQGIDLTNTGLGQTISPKVQSMRLRWRRCMNT